MEATRDTIIAELFDTIDMAKRSIHGHMQMVVEGHNISRTELELLFTIHHLQPTTAKELAKKLNLTAGAISQLVEELSAQSLIDREADPTDRRRHVIRISSQGDVILKGLIKRRHDVMNQVIVHLSDDELVTWLKIQKHIIEVFQSLQDTKDHEQHHKERN